MNSQFLVVKSVSIEIPSIATGGVILSEEPVRVSHMIISGDLNAILTMRVHVMDIDENLLFNVGLHLWDSKTIDIPFIADNGLRVGVTAGDAPFSMLIGVTAVMSHPGV